ncbi:MAG: alginate export family protein [Planctomycetaceae bacterium]|jgi:hypothetical protein|nr:alginate export family protein [Planctomycetaceae bacterium]MBT6483541.1 alginate export family protein [Planctomycetaceae bacterium]MBT6495606.1 alginate export family protein [Planctomycetaceae bacterium]
MPLFIRVHLCALILSCTPFLSAAEETDTNESATNEPTLDVSSTSDESAAEIIFSGNDTQPIDYLCETGGGSCDHWLNSDELLLHNLRDVCLSDGVTLSTGGELRYRYIDEDDRIRPGGPGRSTYDLWRWRHFVQLNVSDWARVYVEGIDASIFDEELPALSIDKNRWDLLNAYAEVRVPLWSEADSWYRYGRQDLQYGKQRLVSTLDWANTRRNFQGHRLYMTTCDWDIDLFTANPVNSTTRETALALQDNERDRPGHDVQFTGLYTSYKGYENRTLDLYWLWKEDSRAARLPVGGRRHTIGMRYGGEIPITDCCCNVARVWDFDMEGAYQFGSDAGADVSAGFFTMQGGHRWKNVAWQPRIGGLFYWGSGDDDPNDGQSNTFDVLYPFGHSYWGIIDNLSGQNLLDYSIQADVKPTDRLKLVAAFHFFDRAKTSDTAYNVARVPFGAVGGSRDIGEELDLIAKYKVNKNLNVQLGYSLFWYGAFVNQNLPRDDAKQLYLMTTLQY